MKSKTTKRSQTDKTLVTIPLAQFENTGLYFVHYGYCQGDEVTVVIEGVPTVCILARPNEHGVPTVMTTHAFPRFLRLPQVGRPVYVEISEIR